MKRAPVVIEKCGRNCPPHLVFTAIKKRQQQSAEFSRPDLRDVVKPQDISIKADGGRILVNAQIAEKKWLEEKPLLERSFAKYAQAIQYLTEIHGTDTWLAEYPEAPFQATLNFAGSQDAG